MTEIDALKATSQLISIFQSVRSMYEQNEFSVTYYDQEYNDLTHALELTNFSASSGYRLAAELKANRVNRRKAKDQVAQLQPLYDLICRNQNFFNELRKVQSQVEKIKSSQSNRQYTPRARTDMQEAFERARRRKGGQSAEDNKT